MPNFQEYMSWLRASLIAHGGEVKMIEVFRDIWRDHQGEIADDGDCVLTWQYDVRWAAAELRDAGIMRRNPKKGVWALMQGEEDTPLPVSKRRTLGDGAAKFDEGED